MPRHKTKAICNSRDVVQSLFLCGVGTLSSFRLLLLSGCSAGTVHSLPNVIFLGHHAWLEHQCTNLLHAGLATSPVADVLQ